MQNAEGCSRCTLPSDGYTHKSAHKLYLHVKVKQIQFRLDGSSEHKLYSSSLEMIIVLRR